MTDRAESAEAIEHEGWKDVSEKTGNKYHWHAKDPGEYETLSIRMSDESSFEESLGGYLNGWTVEMYPYPDNDDGSMERWRFPDDEVEDPEAAARSRVETLMEVHG